MKEHDIKEGPRAALNSPSISSSDESLEVKNSEKPFPRVFFCSRTHSQLQQVIDQLKEMNDIYIENLHSTLLASKSHLCINRNVRMDAQKGIKPLDVGCADARMANKCTYNFKTRRVVEALYHTGASSSGCSTIWDIEDIVQMGKTHRGT